VEAPKFNIKAYQRKQ